MVKIYQIMELQKLSDRELLEAIYEMLVKLSERLDSPQANLNDFMMNILANIISTRLYEQR